MVKQLKLTQEKKSIPPTPPRPEWTHLDGQPVNPVEIVDYSAIAPTPEELAGILPAAPKLADPNALYDLDAEAALCGAILIDGTRLNDCTQLTPADFHDRRHREIWRAFMDLDASGMAIEYLTVCDILTRTGKFLAAGEDAYLTHLLNAPGNSQSAASYARIVADYSTRRHMLAEATDAARQVLDLAQPLPESAARRKTNWTIPELMAADFPDPTGPLPGIIPTGLTILGGRPKRGKSWLMLQCAYALATGGKFLDHDLAKNKVIYYALEDSPRRLKDRLAKFEPDPDALIEFERELKPLHLGGLDQIRAAAEDHYLIVIDTLGRSMPGRDFSKDAGLFADVLGQLQTIAIEKNIAIVVILHTRKPAGMEHDPIDDILGSTQGLTAAPDCVLALYKEQGKTGARLEGRGRDFDDIDLTIEFDPLTCAWQLIGKTGEVAETENEADILAVMADQGKAKPSTVAKELGKNRGHTSTRMAKLWTAGKLRKELINGDTYYYLPEMEAGKNP